MNTEIVASVRRRIVASIAAASSVFAVFTALAYLKSAELIRSSGTHVAERGLGTLQMYLTVGFILGGVSAVLAWYVLNRSVCHPLGRLERLAGLLRQGDLDTDVEGCTGKGIDTATVHVNGFAQGLGDKLDDMVDALSLVLEKVDVLRREAAETVEQSEMQAAQAAQVASTSEELSASINDIAGNASDAFAISSHAMDLAKAGKGVADEATSTVNNMFSLTDMLGSMMENLNTRVSAISDIVTVIEDIADQTNLLALNAAIEAARAGEQGRGFAVVADEVRKLAERTMRATGEISQTIGTVQSETNQTKRSMEAAAGQVTHSRDAIVQMGETLKGITETVQAMHERMTNIATAVEQQSAATEEISASTERSAAISTTINTSARRVLKDVNAMTFIVDKLRGSFANIRTRNIGNRIIELSKGDHRLWVNKVAAHINGDAKLEVVGTADHTQCRLGGWYYAEGHAKCGSMSSFRAMEEPHKRIHALGREIITLVDHGRHEKAKTKFKEMEAVSAQVISLLDSLNRECKH